MSGFSCTVGEGLNLFDAIKCDAYLEDTTGKPHELLKQWTFYDFFTSIDPSYYVVIPFFDCEVGATFDSWFANNNLRAWKCADSLTWATKQCYVANFIGTSWFGDEYYEVVSSSDPQALQQCEFYIQHSEDYARAWR